MRFRPNSIWKTLCERNEAEILPDVSPDSWGPGVEARCWALRERQSIFLKDYYPCPPRVMADQKRSNGGRAVLWSRNFWPEPELEPECRSFGSGSGSAWVVNKIKIYIVQNLACKLGCYSFTKNMENPLFNLKSVIKGSYKANVGARAGSKAETFWKSEPEPERKKSFGSSTLGPGHIFWELSLYPFLLKM
jgi:hypothetical protein